MRPSLAHRGRQVSAPNIKRLIGRINDDKELREIEKAARARIRVLTERRYAECCAQAWERIRVLPVGTTLHVCASGTFVGGPFQRGDSFELTHIQPRAKRVWVTFNGKQYWFEPPGMNRYDLRTEPPATKLDPEARKSIERVAERIFA